MPRLLKIATIRQAKKGQSLDKNVIGGIIDWPVSQRTMQPMSSGKRICLPSGRRLVDDLTRIANKIPAAGISGDFDLSAVEKLRRLTRPKVSWNVLYLKAYALVAAETPELRQFYLGFPWPHLYQADSVVSMLTINREYEGENRLFFGRIHNPQFESLRSLQAKYDHFLNAPVDSIRQFRHQVTFSRMPRPLRQLAWWTMFGLWPSKRVTHAGNIGLSFSGYRGVYGNRHLGPLTSILGADPLPRNGIARLVLTFDHRILDGIPATSILSRICQKMEGQIKFELEELIRQNQIGADPLPESIQAA